MQKLFFALAVLLALLAVFLLYTNINLSLIANYLFSQLNKQPITLINESWLEHMDMLLNGTQSYATQKGIIFSEISYGGINKASLNKSGVQADLKMLYDTNASAIRIDLNYGPWITDNSTQMATYDWFISDIRAHGKKLVIADAAAEYYWNNRLSWSQFKAAWVKRVGTIAARYKPDYYIVIKEPEWYWPMLTDFPFNPPVNASDWSNLTEKLVSTVKSISPNTKVGVSVPAGSMYNDVANLSLPYFIKARNISGLDFMGFDIYGVGDWNATRRFLQTYGSGGKRVWIAESWSSSAKRAFSQSRASLDVHWIKTLYTFAESEHAEYIFPFFTSIFASYQHPPANFSALVGFYQNRTPVFYAYKNITQKPI